MAGANRKQQKAKADQQNGEKAVSHDDTPNDGSENKTGTVHAVPPLVLSPKKKTVAKPTFKSPTRREAKTVTVVKVSPQQITGDALNGFVAVALGFMMDTFLVSKLCLGRGEPEKAEFIDNANAVPWVVTKALDKDGHAMKKRNTGWKRGDPPPCKAVAMLTEEVLPNDEIKKLINETIDPITWNNCTDDSKCVDKNYGEEKNPPFIEGDPSEHMAEVDTWDQALESPTEILRIARESHENLESWLNEDKNNPHQLFREGNAPIREHSDLSCGPHLLRPADRTKHNASITKQSTQGK